MESITPTLPHGYHTVTPYLTAHGARALVAFMEQVFEAHERERITRPDGAIVHADMRIGDSTIMLAEATAALPPMPGALYIYVPDTDATYARALEAGATALMAPVDTFYGDRNAGVLDPFGNRWWIATAFEEVPVEELQQRADAAGRG